MTLKSPLRVNPDIGTSKRNVLDLTYLNWKNKNWKFKLGLLLVLMSLIFFALLVIIPMLDIAREKKIWLTTFSFITAEVLFYSGGFLLGKEMFNKYKSWLNPKNWFKS